MRRAVPLLHRETELTEELARLPGRGLNFLYKLPILRCIISSTKKPPYIYDDFYFYEFFVRTIKSIIKEIITMEITHSHAITILPESIAI